MDKIFSDKDMFNYGRSKMRKCFKYMPEDVNDYYHGCLWPFSSATTMCQKGVEFEYNRTHWLGNVFKQVAADQLSRIT